MIFRAVLAFFFRVHEKFIQSFFCFSPHPVHTHCIGLHAVYGIKGLRVVDGSIMPEIPASHTNAVIFMIGEKAADMVKRTWNGF